MGALAAGRLRLLARFGQPVTLRRGAISATVKGTLSHYRADQLVGPLVQGDARLELPAAGLEAITGGPRNPDAAEVGEMSYTVLYANPVQEGATLIGWSCAVRGG